MKWLNRISSLSLIGFSLLFFFLSLRLGIGNPKDPGTGFMPFLASIILFFLSLSVLIIEIIERERPRKHEKDKPTIGWRNLRKSIILVVALIGYTFLLNIFGFLITTFTLMFIMLSITEAKKWHKNILISAIVVILTFIVFKKLFGIPFPVGIIHITW